MAEAERPFAAESVPLGNGFLFPQFEFQLLPNADLERSSKNVACAKRRSRAGPDHRSFVRRQVIGILPTFPTLPQKRSADSCTMIDQTPGENLFPLSRQRELFSKPAHSPAARDVAERLIMREALAELERRTATKAVGQRSADDAPSCAMSRSHQPMRASL